MITTKENSWTIGELKEIPVVKPIWTTDRFKGIQHGTLVENIHEVLDQNEIQVTEENWFASGKDFQTLCGSMSLDIPGLDPIEGASYSLGIHHSNLGHNAFKFAVGAKIFICSNGMVSGDFVLKHKHTTGLDLLESIGVGVDTYLNKVREVKIVAEAMQQKELITKDVDHALMQAGREGLMGWSRIGQADKEYHKPTFADHNQKTAWGLYNAFTYTMQKMPPQYHMKSMNRFREILVNETAIAA